MTRLRQMMLEELQRRNYSKSTTRYYLQAVANFARHFGKSPDKLGPDELRRYQAYLLRERKLAVGTVIARVAALRFFFIRTLKRHEFREDLPYPKDHRRLPTVLSLEEVARLINAAESLLQRALLMTLYDLQLRNYPHACTSILPSSSATNHSGMCASTPTHSCLHLVAIVPFPTFHSTRLPLDP